MLRKLLIENIAIIDRLEIDFEDGFTILTGETGAGKSIIIDSLSLLLGVKFKKDLIRTGCNRAVVSAIFDFENDNILMKLVDKGIAVDDNNLIITREVYSNGKSICRINNQFVTLSNFKDITNHIFEIHGQNETHMLNEKKIQLIYLDRFCGQRIEKLKEDYKKLYSTYQSKSNQLKQLIAQEDEKERKLDIINFQLNEIDNVCPSINEDIELENRKNIIQNITKLKYNSEKLFHLLNKNLSENLEICLKLAAENAKFDDDFKNVEERLNNIYYEIEDISLFISRKSESYIFNQYELENIIERLDKLNKLKKKYGGTIENVLKFKDQLILEKSNIEKNSQLIEELNQEVKSLYTELVEIAQEISQVRKAGALEFEKEIIEILDQLEMKNIDFKVAFYERDLYEEGLDEIEFLLTTNIGQPLKPLSAIASGGELSRIMLAIKSIVAERDDVFLMIFDEIDSGLSGIAASRLARLLKDLSKKHQVICITHLPQVAAAADAHYYVYKETIENSTFTRIKKLNEEESLKEIARMFSGEDITESSLEHADQLKKMF